MSSCVDMLSNLLISGVHNWCQSLQPPFFSNFLFN
jgi:hypothetical protein